MNPTTYLSKCESELSGHFARIDSMADRRLMGIVEAYRKVGLTNSDLCGSTGYGLGDSSRDKLEEVYSIVFGGESALVRPQIASGTHALACVLFGLSRPGDMIVSITGTPYETLQEVIGIRQSVGSLSEFGVSYAQTDWRVDGPKDFDLLAPPTKIVMIQRSPGYKTGRSVTIDNIGEWVEVIRKAGSEAAIMVDNCYCEFCSEKEPCHAGADLSVGSLIKNPGGGLAFTGGYIVGKSDLISRIATRVTAPGIGAEVGATWGFMLDVFRGLFAAPSLSSSAFKGALLWAKCFVGLGFEVNPKHDEEHADVVVSIKLGSRELFMAFGKAIQEVSPIASGATPVPFDQGGYDAPVMLAGGGFISGGTSDLSCDGLDKPPYWVYVQGGANMNHIRLGILNVLSSFERMGFFGA